MLFLGEAIATGLVMGVKGREGYLYRDGMYWVLLRFLLNLDLCTDHPHRAGPENPWPSSSDILVSFLPVQEYKVSTHPDFLCAACLVKHCYNSSARDKLRI